MPFDSLQKIIGQKYKISWYHITQKPKGTLNLMRNADVLIKDVSVKNNNRYPNYHCTTSNYILIILKLYLIADDLDFLITPKESIVSWLKWKTICQIIGITLIFLCDFELASFFFQI